jgi:uncharacterized protein YoxC
MKKLKEFKKYLFLVKFFENLFISLTILTIFLILSPFLKIKFYIFFISLLPFLNFLYFFKRLNYFKIAREIERKIPSLDEKIITYLEFKDSKNERERKIAENLEKFFENFNFKEAYPFKNIFDKAKIFIYSFIYFLLFLSLFPYKFAEYFVRPKKTSFYLKTEPEKGIFFVPYNLNIKSIPIGEKKIEKIYIEYNFGNKKFYDLMKEVDNCFIYSINVFEPCILKYKLKADGFITKEKELIFKERPFLKSWKVFLENDTLYSPDKIFTFGKKFKIHFYFSGDFDSGYIFLKDSILKKFKDKEIDAEIKGEGFISFSYFIGDKKIDEKELIEIKRGEDSPPFIYVIFPTNDDKINEDLKIPFILYLFDDFSLKNLDLFYEFKGMNSKRIKNYVNEKEDTVYYIFDVSHLSLLPGDTIKLFFEVYDKGREGISKSSRSRIYKFWIPTYTEIYKETEKQMEEGISFLKGEGKEVSDFLRDVEKIKEKIENLREKKERGEIKEAIEGIEKSLEEMSKRFEEYSKKAEELLKRYPLDIELQEKIFKLKELFNEVLTPELKKIFEEIKEAIKKIDPEKLKEAYKNLLLNKEILEKEIERMIELLEKVRQEVKLKELIERMKKIEEKMEGMIKDLEKFSLKDFEEIEEEMKKIGEEMENLSKSFKGNEKSIGEKIEEAKEDFERGLEDICISKNLFSSKENVEKAREKMESALEELFSMRKNAFKEKLEEIFFSSIFLSQKEESIEEKIERKEENIEEVEKEIFNNKEALRRFKDRIVEISRQDINFPRKVLNYAFSAHYKSDELYEKIKILEFEKLKGIIEEIENYLNLIALEILKIRGEGEGGASSALMEALRKLSEMAKEQSHINALTQSLLPLEIGEAPSEEFLKSIQRIAGMQKGLAEKLKQLLKEIEGVGESSLEEKIGKIVEEMEKVAKEIEKGEIKREVLERQERILSRMLELQRSVYKREFTQKRYAERPKPYEPLKPPKKIISEDEIIKINLIKVLNSNIPYEDKKIFIDYLNSLLK